MFVSQSPAIAQHLERGRGVGLDTGEQRAQITPVLIEQGRGAGIVRR